MARGRKPACECGGCKLCRGRRAAMARYNRKYRNDPEARRGLYERSRASRALAMERFRGREVKRGAPKGSYVSDADLDKRALEKWRPEWNG